MKKTVIAFLLLLVSGGFLFSQDHTFDTSMHIIPQPVSLKTGKGSFKLDRSTVIRVDNEQVAELGTMLADMINSYAGYRLKVEKGHVDGRNNLIRLSLQTPTKPEWGDEGYGLVVSSGKVNITANKPHGIFNALQTVMQLLPPVMAKGTKTVIRNVSIVDYPRFGWRGLMLDVSRHFFSKEFVEKYIDQMVKYKFNVFHMHLTDDNGWRIEIKGLPQLTEKGAWRVPRTGRWGQFERPDSTEKATYGGFYTQQDIRDIVKYAQERFVVIVPEIDLPAHSLSLIAVFPNLSCTQQQYHVNPGSPFYEKEDNVLCVANDSTWLMLDKIFSQVAGLFPGQYIHVGGDEAYKGFWNTCVKDRALMKREGIASLEGLQSYFEQKLEKIILSKGKKMIGWDEILEGGLAPEATVMSWRGMQGGVKAAKLGHQVVMSPTTNAYLDLYQSDYLIEPPTYDLLRLSSCYTFEPVPEGVNSKYILGGQGNLWTESVPNDRHAEYMTWPRALALSEAFWSQKTSRNWLDFIRRMEWQFQYLDRAGVKYSRGAYDPIITSIKDANGNLQVKLGTDIPGLEIFYTFDGTNPDKYYQQYEGKPLAIPKGSYEIRVISCLNGKQMGHQINCPINELKNRIGKN